MFGNTPGGEVYIDLYDQETPITVTNFLNYIENSSGERRYDGTFIHRSATNFVIQGGGYKYDPGLGAFSTTTAPHIDQDDPIINEFDVSRSNLRGTVAMAKLGGNPDSATSEWFFNLQDNSANLDAQNGGFTVFGEVLGSGMDVIDSIAALQIINAGSSLFSSLPVTDYVSLSPVTEDNLITIKPSIFITGYPVNFGLVEPGTISQTQSITIQNSDTDDLLISNLDFSLVQAPFSVIDSCSQQTLAPSTSCTVDFSFGPTTPGDFSTSITIPINDVPTPISAAITGRGGNLDPTLEIIPASTRLEFENIAQFDEVEETITLLNSGVGTLQIATVTLSGTDTSSFNITDNTCNQTLSLAETCTLTVKFSESILGDKTATLSINTLPVDQSADITLNGSVVVSTAHLVLQVNDPVQMNDTVINQPVTQTIPINNSGIDDLIITGYSITGSDSSNFSISNNCIPRILSNSPCSEVITFTATAIGEYSSILEIASNDPDSPVTTITINANVIDSSANIVLENQDPIVLADTSINKEVTGTLSINNTGIDDLIVSTYVFTGSDADHYSITDNCLSSIASNTPCTEVMTFSAAATGDYSTTLEISSNDPVSSVTTINVVVNVSQDNDGIRDSIEMAAPNGGDNNKDGIPDAQQDNVASFPDINGDYISLVTDQPTLLTEVRITAENPSSTGSLPEDPNASISFPYGFLQFKLENVTVGGSATATIYLPEDAQLPEYPTYYKFQPPFSIFLGFWFPYDIRTSPTTGAEFNNNTVTLHFIDGAPGDSDREANGIIVDPGGIASITPTIPAFTEQSSGGCSLKKNGATVHKHLEWLILALCLLVFRRRLSL